MNKIPHSNLRQYYHFLIIVALLVFSSLESNAQNMYSLSDWTVGTGDITDFSQYGYTTSNNRELGTNHIGEEVVLWKATPSPIINSDGGVYANYKNIDNTKTYRLSIWIKKTNSDDGITFFGCNSNVGTTHHSLKLDGTLDANPYFWYGDLPKLNHWYLLVTYMHPHNYTGVSIGKIYDGETGEAVLNTTRDYKFSPTATNLRMRAFLYADPNLDDRQYLYKPIMEELTSASPSINRLLRINEESKLVFNYDNSGSQKQRFYCSFSNCPIPTPPIGKPSNDDLDNLITENNYKEDLNSDDLTSNNLIVYPNPTAGRISISLSNVDYHLSDLINIYSINGALVKEIHLQNETKSTEIDISSQPSGVYFIHIHLSNSSVVTRKIIKQ